jgi:hypothetical protein
MPQEVRAEIFDLLQALKTVWPACQTIVHSSDGRSPDLVDRYIRAVQWLADRGLVSFEALMVDMRGLSIVHSSLTSRGHDYARSLSPVGILPVGFSARSKK